MTRDVRRSVLLLVLWGIVIVGFGLSVVSAGGPAGYGDDSVRRTTGAVFVAMGIFGTPALLYLTRKNVVGGRVVADERDDAIARRATQAGLVCVLIYVFLTCIALWDRHQPDGAVPAGWMWFLAYSTLILSYLAPAAASLALHLGLGSHAEG
jgi:hypothetical protein